MNKILKIGLIFCFLGVVFSCKKQKEAIKKTNIQFTKTSVNFGQTTLNKEVTSTFEFSNTGNNLLVISNVKTSCGCTVAKWPNSPIEVGATGKITITYDAKYPGYFNKNINVFYNGNNSPKKLNIKGQIPYPKK